MSGLDNQYYMDFSAAKVSEIKYLLDSLEPAKMFEALKRLCSFSVKGFDVSPCFPQVVKAILTTNLDCKRLIYQFIVINGKKAPDLCLLCVDRLHKDSTENENPLVRGLALRTLSSLSAPEIVQVLQHDVTRATRDSSPYVRKAAAYAITKLVHLEPTLTDSMIELISQMLSKEQNTQVLGPAIFAFNTVCPDRWDLIHPNFRRIVLLLVDLDEWSQILVLNLLLRYARSQFPSPFVPVEEKPEKEEKEKADAADSESESEGDAFENFLTKKDFITSTKDGAHLISSSGEVDDDLRYILTNIQPLLQSSNPGVVLGVATFMFYCSPEAEFLPAAKAVTRLIFQGTPTTDIILRSIAAMAVQRPSLFSAVYRDFFIFDSFTRYGKLVRLTILSHIVTSVNARPILREFAEYVNSQDKVFVCATIHAIYRIALTVPSVLSQCLKATMGLLRSANNDVVGAAIVCIKNLIQYQMANLEHRKEKGEDKKKSKKSKKDDDEDKKDDQSDSEKESERKKKKKSKKRDNFDLLFDTFKADRGAADDDDDADTPENAEKEITKVLIELIAMLHTITNSTARSCIVWLLGHYPHLIPHHAPDTLRELVASFCDEDRDVKFQILTFAAKLQLHAQAILAGEDLVTGQSEGAPADGEVASSASTASKKPVFPAATCELIGKLFMQVQNLARFDIDTDIRERSRFYRSLLNDRTALRRAVSRALIADRPKPSASTESELNLTKFTVGTISHIINAPIPGYKPLPDFPAQADAEAKALRAPAPTSSPITISGADRSLSPQSIRSFYSSGSSSSRSRSRSSSGSSSGSSSSRSRSRSGSRSGSASSRSRSESPSSSASRSRSRSASSSASSRSRSDSRSSSRSKSTSPDTSASTSSSSSRGRKRTRSEKKANKKRSPSSSSSSSDGGAKKGEKDGDADAMFISF